VHPFKYTGKIKSNQKLTLTPIIQNRECYLFHRIILTKQGNGLKLAETKKENTSPEETNNGKKASQNKDNISSGSVSYCRPQSIMRIAVKLLLYVDNKIIAKIPNGASGKKPIKKGQKLKFGNKKNIFMLQPKDTTAYIENINENSDHYYLIKGRADLGQGVAAIIGGAALALKYAESEEEKMGVKNWSVRKVSKSEYENSCK